MTGIESLLNTTEAPPIPKEIIERHQQLTREWKRAVHNLTLAGKRPSRMLREEEEVAQVNLRAFERRFGLTPL